MKTLFKDINWRFCSLAALLVIAVTLTAQTLLMRQAHVALERRLGEKAAFINSFYSFLVADSLQRKDDITLLQIINRLEEDQEITSVIVVDEKGEVRYHADSEKIGTVWDDPLIKKALDTGDGVMTPFQNSGGKALALISPLKVQGQSHPIGAIRIEFTYRHIDQQIESFSASYRIAVFGLIAMAIGIMMTCFHRWIVIPIQNLEKYLQSFSPASADLILPETPDEFGRLHKAINELVIRFRAELQTQSAHRAIQADQERYLLDSLTRTFLPSAHVIIADKDNLVLSDTGNLTQPAAPGNIHLLDLITDHNFATLVGEAFQKEGEAIQGTVRFQDKVYEATIFRVPVDQSVLVRTLIALYPK